MNRFVMFSILLVTECIDIDARSDENASIRRGQSSRKQLRSIVVVLSFVFFFCLCAICVRAFMCDENRKQNVFSKIEIRWCLSLIR